MENGPGFSVIMAVRNGASTIGRAVESVLSQTYSHFELIVVDDGSTDYTADELAKYGTRVRYEYQPPAGVSAARNRGASLARGDWLAFLDADDWYYSERLRWHAEFIREDPALDFLTGDFDYRDRDGKLLRRSMESTPLGLQILKKAGSAARALMESEDELGAFAEQHFGDTHTLSLPRRTFLEMGGYPLGIRVCEDVHLLIRLCARSRRVGVICRPMAVYTIHSKSATRWNPLDAQRETVAALKPLRKELRHALAPVRSGVEERLRRARLDLAYALLRKGRRCKAIGTMMPLLLTRPGLQSLRDCLSVVRGGL